MPTHRPRIAELSTAELAYLARRKAGTVRRQLEEAGVQPARRDGRTLWWNGRAAFQALLGRRDTAEERARLDRARAEAQERRNAIERGDLVTRAEVARANAEVDAVVKARILALPARVALDVASEADPARVRQILEEAVYDVLAAIARGEGAQA